MPPGRAAGAAAPPGIPRKSPPHLGGGCALTAAFQAAGAALAALFLPCPGLGDASGASGRDPGGRGLRHQGGPHLHRPLGGCRLPGPPAGLARGWSRPRRQTARRGRACTPTTPGGGGGQDGQRGAPPRNSEAFPPARARPPCPLCLSVSLSLHLSLVSAALRRRGASATPFFSPPPGAAAPASARRRPPQRSIRHSIVTFWLRRCLSVLSSPLRVPPGATALRARPGCARSSRSRMCTCVLVDLAVADSPLFARRHPAAV